MILEYFTDLAAGIENRIKQEPTATNARKKYAIGVAKLGTRLYSGKHNLAWCGVTTPFDLLNAMDVTSCFVEFVGAMLASTGTSHSFMEIAEQAGYPVDSCSYHRGITGALLNGVMPVPDFVIGTSSPCTSGLAVVENIARRLKKDLFVLHVPQEESKESIKYLADQIKQMVEFVSEHTQKPLDKDRLQKAIEYTNKARELMIQIYELASKIPSPVNSHILRDFGVVVPLFMGTETAVEICTAFRDEFKNIIESGQSGIPDEKIRLMWIQNRIQFENQVEQILEEEYSANIVIDELNDITWEPIDPDNPYIGIARRMISMPLNSNIKKRVEHLQKLAQQYKIHGAINPCHFGCRQGTGARGLIAQGLKDINIPVLNLEVDCVDSRNFAQGQIQTRIEAFMEMLQYGT